MKQTEAENVYRKSRNSEKKYRASKGVNKSTLFAMTKSPEHYHFLLQNQQEDTQTLKIGRAIHAAVLEPEAFLNEWASSPDVDKRTKEGKALYEAFLQKSKGKEILSASDYSEAMDISQAIRNNKAAARLLRNCITEKPLFWVDEETGIYCKCKVDALKPGIMIDLKTSADASTKAFTRDCFKFGYDVQAAHYLNAIETITGERPQWYFIVVEKSKPYAINILKADTGFLDYGIVRRRELLRKLSECRKTRKWAGYGVNDLILPSYMEV